jgi:hypothetical protein
MKRIVSLTALALVLALPLVAQTPGRAASQNFASDFQTVPVMANNAGVGGAPFISYVALLNPTAKAYPVTATLYDTTGATRTATINLAAGELRTWSNFLGDNFNGFTGGGTVTFSSADPGNRFIVSSEITSNRYATPIPSLEFAGTASPSFAPGIWVDATSRTNIGCYNQSSATNTITATVRDRSGAQNLGTITMDLPPRAWGQRAVTTTVIGGYVQFDPTESAVCYAVIVDNATNDGRFLAATEYKP